MTIDAVWAVVTGIFGAGAMWGRSQTNMKVIKGALDKIDTKIDRIDGKLENHSVRLAVLENHEPPPQTDTASPR